MVEFAGVTTWLDGWSLRKMSGRSSSRVTAPVVSRSIAAAVIGDIDPPFNHA